MAERIIPAPRFNRTVILQRAEIGRDSFGGVIETWVDVAEVWASVDQTGTSEKFENDANRLLALRSSQITIHWRPDVRETMRVIYSGLAWGIVGIQEIGRRRSLKLFCQTDVNAKVSPLGPGQRSEEPKDTAPEPPQKAPEPAKR